MVGVGPPRRDEHAVGGTGVDREFAGERRLQVAACAERRIARAGEDADQCVVVGAEPASGFDEFLMCLRANGIHALGSVDVITVTGPRCS
jgi:hypothetical protein